MTTRLTEHLIYGKGPQSCWQQGATAAREGKRLEDNPYFRRYDQIFRDYAKEDKYRSWKNGFSFVQQRMRVEQESGIYKSQGATWAAGIVHTPKPEDRETYYRNRLFFGKD